MASEETGNEGWINVGYQNWQALRHEWKYRAPSATKDQERKRKRIDPELIYNEITGPRKGQV